MSRPDLEQLTKEYDQVMPKEEDLHGAALALVRLQVPSLVTAISLSFRSFPTCSSLSLRAHVPHDSQDTYNVNITEFAAGNIKGTPAYVEMTARDCLYLGKHSFNNGYYGQVRSTDNAIAAVQTVSTVSVCITTGDRVV